MNYGLITVTIRLSPGEAYSNSTFNRDGLFERGEGAYSNVSRFGGRWIVIARKYVAKEPKKRLEVLKMNWIKGLLS